MKRGEEEETITLYKLMNNLQEKKKSKNKKRRGWLFEEKRKKIARLNLPERHKKVKLFPKERNIELTERKLKR